MHTPIIKNILTSIQKVLDIKNTLLDLTFGYGNLSIPFIEKGYNVIGVDADFNVLSTVDELSIKYSNFTFYLDNFFHFIHSKNFKLLKPDGVIIDCGLSDHQINNAFSYRNNKDLKFKIGGNSIKTKALIKNKNSTKMLKILNQYGSGKISLNTVKNIVKSNVKSNYDLFKSIKFDINLAKTIFYALFNYENDYINKISNAIVTIITSNVNVKIMIFCFNSLEVSIVKNLQKHFNISYKKIEYLEYTKDVFVETYVLQKNTDIPDGNYLDEHYINLDYEQ